MLRWLQENDPPAGIATGVSTRITKYRADIAAFWNHKVRNSHHDGPARILKPHRSLIVECYTEREECWPDCAKAQSLIEELKKWKKKRSGLEDEIRRREPELRDNYETPGSLLIIKLAIIATKTPDFAGPSAFALRGFRLC